MDEEIYGEPFWAHLAGWTAVKTTSRDHRGEEEGSGDGGGTGKKRKAKRNLFDRSGAQGVGGYAGGTTK